MLLEFLSEVEDFRRKQGQQYDIGHVLYFSILAVLSGSYSYRKIHQFLKRHFKRFKNKYGLNWKKCPGYTTIRNLIIGINTNSLELVFRRHAKELSKDVLESEDELHLSFDGKVIRGSFDHFKDEKAIQVLSVFCSSNNIILAHENVSRKTNEIPVAQKLITGLGFELALYTCDALNCQEGTIKSVLEANGNLLVQVKENQKNLLEKCKITAGHSSSIDENISGSEKGHGRVEARTCTIYEATDIIHNGKWSDIETIIKIDRDTFSFDTKNKKWVDRSEISYYIATNKLTAKA